MPRISVFARLANGNVAPKRVIEGQTTNLSRTMHGIAYDAIHDEIVIPVALSGAVLVFKADASGEVPPLRAIQGTRTRLVRPHTVAVDPVRNVIVASSRKGNGEKVGIFVFDRLASGDVPPKQFIGGPNSKLAHFRQVAIDPGTGNIFLAQQNTRMKQMEAYVLDQPREGFKARERDRDDEDDDSDSGRLDQMGFIAVYAPDDNGDIPPRAIIKGPGIRLAGAAGVALNLKKKEIITVGGNGFQTFLLPEFFKAFKKPGTAQ